MRKSNKIFLLHILESIGRIENFIKDTSQEEFIKSEKTQDATIRRLEVIGEAVKNLTKKFKSEHPEVKWQKIAGMRNIIVHEYFGIDLKLTYKIAKEEIPELKKNINKLLRGM